MTRCLIAALILVIGVVGCKRGALQSTGAKNAGPPPVSISTAIAHRGDIGVYVNALGVVTPVGTVAVKSRVDG